MNGHILTVLSRRGFVSVAAASMFLAGCGGSLIGPSQPPLQIYVLNPAFGKLGDAPPVSWQLAVDRPGAAESMQTERIALRRGALMDFYADAQWTDPVPRLIQSRLVQAFEASGRIPAVADESAGVRADYMLETEIRSFDAQYQSENEPPIVVVDILARLVTPKGDVVGTRESHHEARAARNAIPSVVEAFDRATGEAIEDTVGWTLELPPRTNSGHATSGR
jgi:cholesterol transport system auxiliary component